MGFRTRRGRMLSRRTFDLVWGVWCVASKTRARSRRSSAEHGFGAHWALYWCQWQAISREVYAVGTEGRGGGSGVMEGDVQVLTLC